MRTPIQIVKYVIYILECAPFLKKNNDQFIKNKTFHQFVKRNNDGLEIITQTSISETVLYYTCVNIVNHISNNIKNLPLTKFKRKFSSYLIEKCFYNLHECLNVTNSLAHHKLDPAQCYARKYL